MSDKYGIRKASNSSLNNSYNPLGQPVDARAADSLVAKAAQAAAKIEKKNTLMARLFPDASQRAAVAGELELVRSEYQAQREALETVRRTQLESLKEACNQYLVGQKAEVRQQVASFLMAKTHELQESLDRTFDDFAASMDAKMAAAEAIERDLIRNVRMQQLKRDFEEFAILQAELADRFRCIVSEGM